MKPVLAAVAVLIGGTAVPGDDRKPAPVELPPPAEGVMDFVRDIKPILDRSCVRCHFSPQPPNVNFTAAKGGLSLSTRPEALRGGGLYDAVIVPGNSAESPLVRLVAGYPDEKNQVRAMPPQEKNRLSKEDVGRLRAWIDQGAVWSK